MTGNADGATLDAMGRIYEPDRKDAGADPRASRKRDTPPSARMAGNSRGGTQTTEQFLVAELFQSLDDHRRERHERRWIERRRALAQVAATVVVVAMGIAGADALAPVVNRIAASYFR